MQTSRWIAVISYLVNKSTHITINELCEHFNVSRRTVYNDLSIINSLLKQNLLQSVSVIPSVGIILNSKQRKFLSDYSLRNTSPNTILLTKDQRIAFVYCLIYANTEPLNALILSDILDLSRNTFFSDLKQLKSELKKYGVDINFSKKENTFFLVGDNVRKRSVFMYYFENILFLLDDNFSLILERLIHQPKLFDRILERLNYLQNYLNTEFVQGSLELLAALLSTTNLGDIDLNFAPMLPESSLIIIIDDIFKDWPENERQYVCMCLLGFRLQTDNLIAKSYYNLASDLAEDMILKFEQITAIDLKDTDLKSQLTNHLSSSLHRMIFGILIKNPLLEDMKKYYRSVYSIVDVLCEIIRTKLNVPVFESEVAFITAIFGGYLRNTVVDSKMHLILVVCPNGNSISQLLKTEIESLSPSYSVTRTLGTKAFYETDIVEDYIISTVNLDRDIKYILVNPIISDEDRKRIITSLPISNNRISKNFTVENILKITLPFIREDEQTIYRELVYNLSFSHERQNSPILGIKDILQLNHVSYLTTDKWEEAFRSAGELLKNTYINMNYITRIIESVTIFGPYFVFDDYFALAHTDPQNDVYSLGLSICFSHNPIYIDDHSFQCLVVIAPVDFSSHLRIISQLITIFSDQSFSKKLIELNDSKAAYLAIIEFMNDHNDI